MGGKGAQKPLEVEEKPEYFLPGLEKVEKITDEEP